MSGEYLSYGNNERRFEKGEIMLLFSRIVK
jgi:hypothetical protein